METPHCSTCKRAVTRSELSKTVPGGHKLTYQIWHHACGTRVDGMSEHRDASEYADIAYSDQYKYPSVDPVMNYLNKMMSKLA